MNAGDNVNEEKDFMKKRLFEIEKAKLSEFSHIFQSSSLVENEKMGIFQIAQNNDRKLDTSRLKIGNEITSDSLKIKDEFLTYYKSIFQDNEQFSRSTEFPSLNNIAKQLNHDQKQYLIHPITAEELLNALSTAAKKKSPGIDGLSYEFYLKNYDFFKEDLIKLCNSYLVDGDGVVIFIP